MLTYQFYLRNQLGYDYLTSEQFIESTMILLGIDHVQHSIVTNWNKSKALGKMWYNKNMKKSSTTPNLDPCSNFYRPYFWN